MSFSDEISIISEGFAHESPGNHSGDDYSIEQEIDIDDDNSIDNKSFLDLEYASDEV